MALLRIVLGIVAGLALGVLIVALGERVNHMLWPPPQDLQITDPEAVREFLAGAPLAALIGLPLIWTIAAGAGGFMGGYVSQRVWPGWVAGGLLYVATILNLMLIPHPWWMWAAGLIAPPIAVWFASAKGAH